MTKCGDEMTQLTLDMVHVYTADVSAARTIHKISQRMNDRKIKFKIINCNVSTSYIVEIDF